MMTTTAPTISPGGACAAGLPPVEVATAPLTVLGRDSPTMRRSSQRWAVSIVSVMRAR